MSSMKNPVPDKKYWRSLGELGETAEFRRWLESEFPAAMPELSSSSRRSFLRLMGASMALAGLTACRWPKETILPFARRPEGRVPGVPERYATVIDVAGAACGLLVTSYDGRPIKVEGNPRHPISRGATDALAQAAVLELYDPDRSTRLVRREGGQQVHPSWSDFDAFAAGAFAELRSRGGRGLHVLSGANSSPSFQRMAAEFRRSFPQARWHEYEALSRDNERQGVRMAFGQPLRAHLRLERAAVIACFDADPIHDHPAALAYARDFADSRRRVDESDPSRLYAVESAYSLTGAVADRRLAVRPAEVGRILVALAGELAGRGLFPAGAGLAAADLDPRLTAFAAALAEDLAAHAPEVVVTVGPRQPAAIHALAHLINDALGALGRTVTLTADPDDQRPSHFEAIAELAAAIDAGAVETLLIIGGNPAYDAPVELGLAEKLGQVDQTLRLGLYEDETSEVCTWHLPMAHFLETWGDGRAWDGTVSVAQPLIEPLYGGRSAIELLSLLTTGTLSRGHAIVRRTLEASLGGAGFEKAWRRSVHDGVVEGSALPELKVRPAKSAIDALRPDLAALAGSTTGEGGIELVFTRGATFDGRYANNAWLQELPDPLTKLTWDNALLLGPSTAEALGAEHGEMVALEVEGRRLEVPVFVAPGQARGTGALALGYGRRKAGRVGDGVGVDANILRSAARAGWLEAVRVTPLGRSYPLSCTQDHFAIDQLGRDETSRRVGELVREADLTEYREQPDFVHHRVHEMEPMSMWKEWEYDGHKWGMAIDLNTCIGCSACVVACQAENNTPVVGKQRVGEGREMHWLRIDRYYKGEPDEAGIAFQPVACHHCEDAPCESVCPVAATVHDSEGLNVMVYNRCVGTRYCSNNCPYKVRHFNYFNYHKNLTELEALVHNPEVTVRSRGVMEKCTYCTQRIQAVKIQAANDQRPIADGEIVPACAQVCPTQAIVFGDLSDPDSRVARAHAHQRAYGMLEELNVKPRTRYLGKVRNPPPGSAEHGSKEHH
ncbi:MAG TPA: 4Fe-4S dicluster domain-containing protein [Acidobacteria bacterium]|nr:4Fe-4S dicluster domain-containing protein [Acidobacteriota bacterium]